MNARYFFRLDSDRVVTGRGFGLRTIVSNARSNASSLSSTATSRAMSMNRFSCSGSLVLRGRGGLRGITKPNTDSLPTETALRFARKITRPCANRVRICLTGTDILFLHSEKKWRLARQRWRWTAASRQRYWSGDKNRNRDQKGSS
jgi:hypothetical protein